MEKLLLLVLTLMSTSSYATTDGDVENYCLDFGMLISSLVINKATERPIDLTAITQRGESIGEQYGTPNFQNWAKSFSTTVVKKISNMTQMEVVEIYNENNGDLVRLTSVFKYVCHKQIK